MEKLTKSEYDVLRGYLDGYCSIASKRGCDDIVKKAAAQAGCSQAQAKNFLGGISKHRHLHRHSKPSPAPTVKRWLEIQRDRRLRREYPYRVNEISSWVGNSRHFCVEIASQTYLSVSSTKIWHKTKVRSAMSFSATLYLNPADAWFVSGGLLTILRREDKGKEVAPATWYTQGRGFEVNKVVGYLVTLPGELPYHVEAASPELALAKAKKAKDKKAAQKEPKPFDQQVFTKKIAMRRFGFCEAGVTRFCEVNGIDPDGRITGKELRAVVVERRVLNCRLFASHLSKMGIALNCK
jgi:hypothetical protein